MNRLLYNIVPLGTLGVSIVIAITLNNLLPIAKIIPNPFNFLGVIIIGVGFLIAAYSLFQLKKRRTTTEPGGSPSMLITSSLFALSRNPIYLGDLLICLGVAILLSSLSAFLAPAVFFVAVDRIVLPFEERMLEKNFGVEYERYKKSVRPWI